MQMRMVKEWNRFVLQPNTGVILQNHEQNTRKPKRCEENQEAGDHRGQPVAAPTSCGSHHGPTVVVTGLADPSVSPVPSSSFIIARDACLGTSVLGHFGPLLAFFFDLQGLKIIFYSYNLGL